MVALSPCSSDAFQIICTSLVRILPFELGGYIGVDSVIGDKSELNNLVVVLLAYL